MSVRKGYLLSCAVALTAAIGGLATTPPDSGMAGTGRAVTIAIAFAAAAVFGGGMYLAWTGEVDDPTRSERRLRRMSLLWLGLAVALGIGMAKGWVVSLVSDGPAPPGASSWVPGLLGTAVVAVASWRLIATLRKR